MNIDQGMFIRPPYNTKNNEILSAEHYQRMPHPNSSIQQIQPLPIGNPMLIASGDHPITCNCPHCYQPIVTRIEKNNGLIVWLAAGGICLFGCFCGCCLIPFCINDLKDTIHYCPNCNRVIGENKKL